MLLLSTCFAPSCYNNPSMLHQSNNAPSCYKNPYGESEDIRFHDFGPNWTQIAHLPQKELFWEKLTSVKLSTYCVPPRYNISEKILREDHEIQRCMILDQIGPNWGK